MPMWKNNKGLIISCGVNVLFLVIIISLIVYFTPKSCSTDPDGPTSPDGPTGPDGSTGPDGPNIYPSYWGPEPVVETKDIVDLPYTYGKGSSTKKIWIEKCMELEKQFIGQNKTTWNIPEEMHKDTVHDIFKHFCVPSIIKTIEMIPDHHMVTADYNVDRLRLSYDETTKIVTSLEVRVG